MLSALRNASNLHGLDLVIGVPLNTNQYHFSKTVTEACFEIRRVKPCFVTLLPVCNLLASFRCKTVVHYNELCHAVCDREECVPCTSWKTTKWSASLVITWNQFVQDAATRYVLLLLQLLDTIPPVTASEITKLLTSTPSKSSTLDYIPTSLLKSLHLVFSGLIAKLAILSFQEG